MGKNLADNYEEARRVFEEADEALRFPLSELCFYGPEEELTLTRNAQPGIVATSVAAFAVMRSEGIIPDIVSGHSSGANCLNFSRPSLPEHGSQGARH
jgi:[acyl-carrier-protein] S-malonyltransferase